MLTSSAKAKGRALQKWVVDHIIWTYPELTRDDVKSTGMGQGGVDVQLSTKAKALFNFKIECKNQEGFKKIYDAYEQCIQHGTNATPVVFIKSNRQVPLAVVDADYFIQLTRKQ